MAIHELGHLWALPLESDAHISFSNPCLHCDGAEGQQSSLAHTGYSAAFQLTELENRIYTLSGGAAEIACGLPKVLAKFELGEFPASMENDLADFKELFTDDVWVQLKSLGEQILDPLIRYFSEHKSRLWRMQKVVRENRFATASELKFEESDHNDLAAAFES